MLGYIYYKNSGNKVFRLEWITSDLTNWHIIRLDAERYSGTFQGYGFFWPAHRTTPIRVSGWRWVCRQHSGVKKDNALRTKFLAALGRKAIYGLELILIIISTINCATSASAVEGVGAVGFLGFWRFFLGMGIGGTAKTNNTSQWHSPCPALN